MEDDDDDDDRCDAFFNIDNMDGGNCFELFLFCKLSKCFFLLKWRSLSWQRNDIGGEGAGAACVLEQKWWNKDGLVVEL